MLRTPLLLGALVQCAWLNAQLVNPGFEDGLNGWQTFCPEEVGITFDAPPNGGQISARLRCLSATPPDCWNTQGIQPLICQPLVGAQNGSVLQISLWAKAQPDVAGDEQWVSAILSLGWLDQQNVLNYANGGCSYVGAGGGSTTWTEGSLTCTLTGFPEGVTPMLFLSGHAFNNTNGHILLDNVTTTLSGPIVTLNAKAWLDGAYDSNAGLMRDDLRTLQRIPAQEPYSVNYCCTGGGETVAPTVLQLSGNNAVVDWVRLELRTGDPQSSQLVAVRHALLQRDGDIVDVNGSSPVSFPVGAGAYWVVLRHRNHLAVMNGAPLQLSVTPTTLDFRASATACYTRPSPNSDAPRRTVGSTRTLWAGNITADDRVKYTGAGNDRDPLLLLLGGQPNTVNASYTVHDVNMDGFAKYTGSGNDRDPILITVGSTTPNGVRIQQVP